MLELESVCMLGGIDENGLFDLVQGYLLVLLLAFGKYECSAWRFRDVVGERSGPVVPQEDVHGRAGNRVFDIGRDDRGDNSGVLTLRAVAVATIGRRLRGTPIYRKSTVRCVDPSEIS